MIMLKGLGAIMLITATSYVGWQVAARYARRPRQVRELQTALAVLQTEIEYGATPIPEACRAAALSASPEVGALFEETALRLKAGGGISPGEALRGAVVELGDKTALNEADLEVLTALGQVLGASGRQDQVRHLSLARERLAGQESTARDEQQRYERTARYLGVLSGLAAVLILI